MQWIRGGKDQTNDGKESGWETRKVVIEDYAFLSNDKAVMKQNLMSSSALGIGGELT